MQLAALNGNHELRRSFSMVGLARFFSGADADASRVLAEPLLLFPPDPSTLPLIQQLVERASRGEGSPWTRVLALFPLALWEYRSNHFEEASRVAEKYIHENTTGKRTNPFLASGWFLLSAVEMRLQHSEAARNAYREGLRQHSLALRRPGIPYEGADWAVAGAAELLRREAASLLGDATPPDSPAASKP